MVLCGSTTMICRKSILNILIGIKLSLLPVPIHYSHICAPWLLFVINFFNYYSWDAMKIIHFLSWCIKPLCYHICVWFFSCQILSHSGSPPLTLNCSWHRLDTIFTNCKYSWSIFNCYSFLFCLWYHSSFPVFYGITLFIIVCYIYLNFLDPLYLDFSGPGLYLLTGDFICLFDQG